MLWFVCNEQKSSKPPAHTTSLPLVHPQDMSDCWSRHVALMSDYGVFTPKSHLMAHVIHRAPTHGNPWLYACFLDEGLNKQLKSCLRLCHQANFEAMAFVKIEQTLLAYFTRQCDRAR